MSLPPDLRVLCQKLAAASPGDLPRLCPSLVGHVLRCAGPLSTPVEAKGKGGADESAVLVHRLKTQINTLLNGRTPQSRFAGMVLVKAVVDVGGWECLRTLEPWVRGLLSILQKPDPPPSKELCIVALTRIYSLLHGFQTLVREIATPTIPTFVTACLQMIKPAAPGRPPRVPMGLVETVVSALSSIVPLYPTTLRPFGNQIRATVRAYLAPTSSDVGGVVVPQSLRTASRRLVILLHYTAPKNGPSEEWAKALDGLLKEANATANQVFRAVQETWESTSGFSNPRNVSPEGEPQGGSDSAAPEEQLPSWVGLESGAQRLIGLLETMDECFSCRTKAPVTVPLGAISDLIMRLSLVLPPPLSADTHSRDYVMETNPSIGREEREELWAALPDIHVGAMRLLLSLLRRLGSNAVPLAPEALDQVLRMFRPSRRLPTVRETTFTLIRELLLFIGPSLPKTTVDSLDIVIQACCADLLAAAGYAQPDGRKPAEAKPAQNGTKGKTAAMANADLFLNPTIPSSSSASPSASSSLVSKPHLDAADALLAALLSHLPQDRIKKAERAQLDRAAVLAGSQAAMLASVLHPYTGGGTGGGGGKRFASTLPFLARAHPRDDAVEVLRCALRTERHVVGDVFARARDGDGREEDEGEEEDSYPARRKQPKGGHGEEEEEEEARRSHFGAATDISTGAGGFDLPTRAEAGPTAVPRPATAFEPLSLKRKSDSDDGKATKRLDKGKKPAGDDGGGDVATGGGGGQAGEDDSGSEDGSDVVLEMVFDDDDDGSRDGGSDAEMAGAGAEEEDDPDL